MPESVKNFDDFLLFFEMEYGTYAARRVHLIVTEEIGHLAKATFQSLNSCRFLELMQPSMN